MFYMTTLKIFSISSILMMIVISLLGVWLTARRIWMGKNGRTKAMFLVAIGSLFINMADLLLTTDSNMVVIIPNPYLVLSTLGRMFFVVTLCNLVYTYYKWVNYSDPQVHSEALPASEGHKRRRTHSETIRTIFNELRNKDG